MSSSDLEVDVGYLRDQAKKWDNMSTQFGRISSEVLYNRNEGTDFDLSPQFYSLSDSYNAACQRIGELCGEGKDVMGTIADTLVEAARTYDQANQEVSVKVTKIGNAGGVQLPPAGGSNG